MNPATIIQHAAAEGVMLVLSSTGTIKATGDDAIVARWLPTIREHKVDIVAVLSEAANDRSSWGWLLHCANHDPAAVYCSPVATHAEILAMFPDAIAAVPIKPIFRKPLAPMDPDDESAIRAWLELIGEANPVIVADTLQRSRDDADARGYFIAHASEQA